MSLDERDQVPGQRLGWRPSPPALKAAALRLEKYLPSALPTAPGKIDVSDGVEQWPMYANDRLGDCTCAAAGHMLEVFTKQVTGSARILQDEDVIALYDLVNGGVDEGANEMDVLSAWRQQGLAGEKLFAYCAVRPQDLKLVATATWLFSGLYIGVALPRSAQGRSLWDVEQGPADQTDPGTWGGHAVNVVSLDQDAGGEVITWGQRLKFTWPFWQKYVIEAWALIPLDYDQLQGKPLDNGFDADTLKQDLAEIAS